MTRSPSHLPPNHSTLTLVSLAAVPWHFPLVGRTRMLTEAWHAHGQPCLFVESPSLRTFAQRLTLRAPSVAGAPVVRTLPVWPLRWCRGPQDWRLTRSAGWSAAALLKALRRRVDLEQAAALVVTPAWTPWLRKLPFRTVIYDCIDELSVHVPAPRLAGAFREWEDELLQRAAGAVVSAERLGADLRERKPGLPIRLIRNGVDAAAFQGRAAAAPRPVDVPTGRPIIGFVGALYSWIDWELISGVIRRLPECQFVFVGPDDGNDAIAALRARPNVVFLGPRPYELVPAYVKAFDVCWIPFRQDEVALSANPVKAYEYLSLGKPVVSTPIADAESFGDCLAIVKTPDEAADALRAAMHPDAAVAARRVAFASDNTWQARAKAYLEFTRALRGG
ncbi:putative teichuronic acid biosynthesis glycosyltransferase TuaH [Phycisphaerae bacterium RAS1]|nr:putative teichuronic acid biosynthesis glycosyltransferase TuaH [Phycisphaerae bacterium RAS1]